MQTYQCSHCGTQHPSILMTYLHIWTDHMHMDMALDRDQSEYLIAASINYNMKGVLCTS